MNPASKTSVDRSLEMKLEDQAERLVINFKSRLKQLLRDEAKKHRSREDSVATIKEITWDHLFKVLMGKYENATNIDEVLDKTEKALHKLIDNLAASTEFEK